MYAIETVSKQNNKNYYLLLNVKNIQDHFEQPNFKKLLADKKVELTGRVYTAKSTIKENAFQWSTNIPSDAQDVQELHFENLCSAYQDYSTKIKVLEKDIKKVLDNEPDNLKLGKNLGAYNSYTISDRKSYQELYDLAKQLLLKKENPDNILKQLNKKEKEMTSPHKSSSESFKVFSLDDKKDEILGKLYKETK